ncbi:MAG: alpha amylase C-terminal domain-containing protein, partial [Clostridium sp.]
YYDFRIGVPYLADYIEIFNSDDSKYGGSGQIVEGILVAEKQGYHNQKYSVKVKVPPMGVLVLSISKFNKEDNHLKEFMDIKSLNRMIK